MAVETIPIPLGFKAPDFTLLDTNTGENKSLSELSSDLATVVMFICNHCPYVKHINQGLNDLAIINLKEFHSLQLVAMMLRIIQTILQRR